MAETILELKWPFDTKAACEKAPEIVRAVTMWSVDKSLAKSWPGKIIHCIWLSHVGNLGSEKSLIDIHSFNTWQTYLVLNQFGNRPSRSLPVSACALRRPFIKYKTASRSTPGHAPNIRSSI